MDAWHITVARQGITRHIQPLSDKCRQHTTQWVLNGCRILLTPGARGNSTRLYLHLLGDALCLAAGWLRLHWLPCCLFMALGKFARYWLVAQTALNN